MQMSTLGVTAPFVSYDASIGQIQGQHCTHSRVLPMFNCVMFMTSTHPARASTPVAFGCKLHDLHQDLHCNLVSEQSSKTPQVAYFRN